MTDTPPDVPDAKAGAPDVPTPRVTVYGDTPTTPPPDGPPPAPRFAPADVPDTGNGKPDDQDDQDDPKPKHAAKTPAGPNRPADQVIVPAPPPPGADGGWGDDDETPRPHQLSPRHLRRPQTGEVEAIEDPKSRNYYLLLVPAGILALFGVLIVAWAIDSNLHGGQVQRNVSVAGHAIGGAGEDSLAQAVSSVAEEIADRPVAVQIQETELEMPAGELGLTLDEQAVIDEAMDVGRSEPLWRRPFDWLGSLLSDRTIDPSYRVSESQIAGSLQTLRSEHFGDRVDPSEPVVELDDGEFVLVPGQPGTDVDVDRATDDLLTAAREDPSPEATIDLTVHTTEFEPTFTNQEVQDLAARANAMTAGGLVLEAGDAEQNLSAEELRSWITPVVETGEDLDLRFDLEAASERIPELFSELSAEPQDATVRLSGNSIEITESESGVTCCGDDAGERVWAALQADEPVVELDVEVVEPEHTTEEVEGWGIVEPVGGSRGWRNGQGDVSGPKPGFTTWEVGSGGRAHNIRLMADTVNGAVVPPGGTFSINEHVGARQCPPYQEAGAILEGVYVDDCGGGTSQFATTFLNAAYFAGLDITQYQAHSEYFGRYPRGREATMGPPGTPLDVAIRNDTPYGLLIQATHSGDTVTVTFWSTQHIDVAQTDISESEQGNCTRVTTTRTRTFPDGSTRNDQFTALYRPGEGEFC